MAAIAATGVLVAVPGASAGTASKAGASVRPAVGGPHTRFVVSFRATMGKLGVSNLERHYAVVATGPRTRGCASSAGASITVSGPVRRQRVHLSPGPGAGFCRGRFRGSIRLELTPICARPVAACPMFVIDGGIVGRFTFKVK